MSAYAVYVYSDADRNQEKVAANELSWTGTWSSSGSYYAASLDAVLYGNDRYIAVRDNVGVNPTARLPNRAINPFSLLVVVQSGSEPPFSPPEPPPPTDQALYEALSTAWAGTALAETALRTAWSGTAGVGQVFSTASAGTLEAAAAIALANQALQTAWTGTTGAGATAAAYVALQTAWVGTAAAAAGITLANQALVSSWNGTTATEATALAYEALQTAWAGTRLADEALQIAIIGTNSIPPLYASMSVIGQVANDAYSNSLTGTNAAVTAYQALQTAWTGTQQAAVALNRAEEAYYLAMVGTNTFLDLANGIYLANYHLNEVKVTAEAGTLRGASAIDLANQALTLSWIGTQAYALVSAGTDASAALALANQAIQTAWAGTLAAYNALQMAWYGTAYTDAQVGAEAGFRAAADIAEGISRTNADGFLQVQIGTVTDAANAAIGLANQALQTAWSGTAGVGQVAVTASAGTLEAAAAIALANQALMTAWVGTASAGPAGGVSQAVWSGGTVVIDFSGSEAQMVALGGHTFFTGANYSAGPAVALKITSGGSYALTFKPDWQAVGALPTYISAGATGVVAVQSYGTVASQAIVAYAATDYQPGGTGDQTLAYTALQTAWAGTALAYQAGTSASMASWPGTNAIGLANQALQLSWAGTNAIALANHALQTAWVGTDTGGGGTVVGSSVSVVGTTAMQFAVHSAKLPSSSPMRIDASEQEWRLLGTKGQSAFWQFVAPPDYGSGLKARLAFAPAYAQTGTTSAAVWGVSVAASSPGDATAVQSKSFAVINYGTFNFPASIAAGAPQGGSINISNNDGIVPGDLVMVKVERGNLTADTLQGDIALYGLALEYSTNPMSLTSGNPAVGYGTVPYSSAVSGTIAYDFMGSAYQETTVNGDLWVSGVNMSAGREIAIVLVPDGSSHAIGYSNFKWFGTTPPYSIFDKEVIIALTAKDTTIANTKASSIVQV